MRAIFIYHIEWEIIEMDRLCEIVFTPIKTMLDRDRDKWTEYIEKQSSNGKLGWRPNKSDVNPLKAKKPTASLDNPLKAKKADSVSVPVNVSVNVSDNVTVIDKTETDSTIVLWRQAVEIIEKDTRIDHRNSGTQRIIDIIRNQVELEWFLYDSNPQERNRATIIAKRQTDWWATVKDSPDEIEEQLIRSIISYSNQNEYVSKIRSAKDFHEKWRKVANSMKESAIQPVRWCYV